MAGQGSAFVPELPPFDEKHDDIDSFLFRFEKYAEVVGWSKDQYAIFLSTFLRGEALVAFHEIAGMDNFSFQMLKDYLLMRFGCSVEDYKNKFRSAKPEQGVPMTVFLGQLRHSFSRWIELSNTEKTYNAVVDLFLREQFLSACSSNLATFLREKGDMTAKEMADIAERYRLAHEADTLREELKTDNLSSASAYSHAFPRLTGRKKRSKRGCFVCRDPRHKAADCPKNANIGNGCSLGGNNTKDDCVKDQRVEEINKNVSTSKVKSGINVELKSVDDEGKTRETYIKTLKEEGGSGMNNRLETTRLDIGGQQANLNIYGKCWKFKGLGLRDLLLLLMVLHCSGTGADFFMATLGFAFVLAGVFRLMFSQSFFWVKMNDCFLSDVGAVLGGSFKERGVALLECVNNVVFESFKSLEKT